jgi:hypothetical protein
MKEVKIYKSVWQVVVLSGEPVGKGMGFEEMVEKIDDGDCLGSYSLLEQSVIEGTEGVERACEEVGRNGNFFTLNEERAEESSQ